jgi:hypothetical protein
MAVQPASFGGGLNRQREIGPANGGIDISGEARPQRIPLGDVQENGQAANDAVGNSGSAEDGMQLLKARKKLFHVDVECGGSQAQFSHAMRRQIWLQACLKNHNQKYC